LNKYKMGQLEGNFTPVLYIGPKVPKGHASGSSDYKASNAWISD
jgi:hypothetical protein